MDLDLAALDLSVVGAIHTAAGLVAVLAGLLILLLQKGSPGHRWRGRLYLTAMFVTNLTAFGTFKFGVFGLGHAFALVSLAQLAIGLVAVRRRGRRWAQVHGVAMASSFFLLVLAGIGESFGRIPLLAELEAAVGLPLLPASVVLLLAVTVASLTYLWRITARRFVPDA